MFSLNNKEEIDRVYAQLSPRADLVYSFVSIYNSYINEKRIYGGVGPEINMVEVHTLTMIHRVLLSVSYPRCGTEQKEQFLKMSQN